MTPWNPMGSKTLLWRRWRRKIRLQIHGDITDKTAVWKLQISTRYLKEQWNEQCEKRRPFSWNATPCKPVGVYRRFGWIYCFHHPHTCIWDKHPFAFLIEAAGSSETSDIHMKPHGPASHARRQESAYSPTQEPQISEERTCLPSGA